jgi:hypothetical protein
MGPLWGAALGAPVGALCGYYCSHIIRKSARPVAPNLGARRMAPCGSAYIGEIIQLARYLHVLLA